jgi:LPXTG-site transpeptidase (sortase) family protein
LQKWLVSGKVWSVVGCLALAAGVYLLLTALAPSYIPSGQTEAVKQKLRAAPEIKEDRLYISAIGVDVAIVEGDSEAALEKGAWHRRPQNGNPEKGGNFVLSAHRFQMGITPQQTSGRSPFYNIDKLKEGDEIQVDYNKKRYAYKISRKYQVDRYAVSIEDPSVEAKMTLYSCDLRGEQAGREVIEARPV